MSYYNRLPKMAINGICIVVRFVIFQGKFVYISYIVLRTNGSLFFAAYNLSSAECIFMRLHS